MSDGGWQAGGPVERGLVAARAAGDDPAFLLTLARADLLLLMPDDVQLASDDGQLVSDDGQLVSDDHVGVWAVSPIEGRSCLVAFTSVPAMTAVLGEVRSHRRVRIAELAATWPSPDLNLATDPGLPIEALLDADAVQDLAALSAQPATQREARLLQALDSEDIETYVAVLMEGDVLLPVPGDGSRSVDVTDPGFAWCRLPAEALGQGWGGGAETVSSAQTVGPGPILAFTSPERLRDLIGDQPCIEVPFAVVAHAWPDASDLLVDPGLAHGGALAGVALQHLRTHVRNRLGGGTSPGRGSG